jgi:hypothetical protein
MSITIDKAEHCKLLNGTKQRSMWLQIDIYPAVEEANGTAVPASLVPAATHYVRSNPTTGTEEECLWSIGRKAGQYHATKDRSVSREHLRLLAASDADQVIVKNLGKLGSYLVRADPLGQDNSHTKANKDDDDDSSVTTVDEDDPVLTQKSLALDISLSRVAQHFAAPQTTQRLQPVNLDESLTLPFLSPSLETPTENPSSLPPSARWILQCGKMGTTIVLTRIDICFVASSNKAKNALRSMHEALTAVGARAAETFSASEHAKNYLLTDTFGAKPKHILAWARHATVVHATFLETFLAHAGSVAPLQAPWPPDDTVPALAPSTNWSPGPPDPQLWKDGILFSLLPENVPTAPSDAELEELVLATGAQKISLLSFEALAPLWQKTVTEEDVRCSVQQFWVDFQVEYPHSFVLKSTHAKSQYPLVAKILEEVGVPFLTGKVIAQAVTQQQALEELLPARPAATASFPVAAKVVVSSPSTNARHSTRRSGRKPPLVKETVPKEDDEEAIVESPVDMALDVDSVPDVDEAKPDDDDNDLDMGKYLSSEEPDKDDSRGVDDVLSDAPFGETTLHDARLTDKSGGASPKKRTTSSVAQRSWGAQQNAPKGWMTALPQGQSRKKFRRSDELAKVADGEERMIYEPAITQTVKGLIATNIATSTTRPAPSTTAIPNFKAFRKNVVPPVLSVGIALQYGKSSNSKALYHGDLDKQREQMEAQQRRADELFR